MKQILVLNEDQEVELLHEILTTDCDCNSIVSREVSIEEVVEIFEKRHSVKLVVLDPFGRAIFLEK